VFHFPSARAHTTTETSGAQWYLSKPIVICFYQIRRPFQTSSLAMFYAASVLLLALHQAKQAIASECRVIPEDPEWPSVDAWDSLNSTVDGRLVQTVPVGTPCYAGPSFNEDECQAVQASWHNPDFQYVSPFAVDTN